ncbi:MULTISPECIES: GbsR/MarR family transcriptional regulator [Pontibacillus]|uniref:HTH-type transcriptional regulator n=1 Tax=Pontibacillus chungwhensis TaxID=265426 RepID=A0ABY8V2V6_9BACI|nr:MULTISPECIES: transcriptional regulator [Pontibacillus]MCD5324962.1 transcriptional regulator [Pontibacillus sp. HN14]WIF98920.1 transcriptional regulator [Pontibacillus chungwhensis]
MSETENNSIMSEVQYHAITEFSKTIEMFSLTPSEALLFSTLYIEGEPMTLDEMSEALAKSKTSMSTGIRSLLDLNLVERVWKKGVRKDLYAANSDLFNKFMSSYIHKWLDAANRQKHSLEETKLLLDKEEMESNEANRFEEKLNEMIEFHCLISKAFSEIDPSTSDQ